MNSSIKKKIESCYNRFFREVGINVKNGVYKNSKLKFATFPYIGNQYGKNTKILFVGLEIGKDEYLESIGSFKERQESIGNSGNYENVKYNPHIAGTLVTAAYFNDKSKVWEKIKKAKSYNDAIRKFNKKITNPLSYITLTNFFKRVTEKRISRTGSFDRKYFSSESCEHEWNLLFSEIEIFNPKIIIFQSVEFLHHKYKDFFNKLKNKNKTMKIYIGPHPTCWPPYSRIPKKYLKYFKLIDKIKWKK